MATNQMEVIRFNLKRQNEQADALIEVIDRVEKSESNVNDKFSKMSVMLDDVKDSVTIYYDEQKQLQSIVSKKANRFAKDYYDYDENYGAEIRELAGYAIRIQWKLLKERFRLARYTSLRRVDFEDGKEFLGNIQLNDSFITNFKKWKAQKMKKQERELNTTRQG